jgi:UDP-N-acetylmuramoyl-L-alanyl-D-glutamate--2,6-diaminopimelate ligase
VIGTIGARIDGVPLPGERTTPEATELQLLLARMVEDGVGMAAIEVSSHALVMHRVDGTRFAAACFTNLSHDHLDFHASLEEYFEAKALLFDPALTDAAAANLDDSHGAEIARRAEAAGLSVLGFGLESPAAAVRAVGLDAGPGGNRFELVTPYGSAAVHSPLVGRFNASNALAAAATALVAGLDVDSVAAGLSAPLVVPGRMERIDAGQPFAVLVDYAHTPDGLEQVLRAARPLVAAKVGRLVVVFGCGGDRDRAKRPAMGKAAAALADILVVTSDNPRSEDPMAIIDEVVTGIPAGTRPVIEPDRRRAIRHALHGRTAGDVVVVAGKGHESGQTSGGVTVPFDDRVVATEELAALGWVHNGGTAA